jgi:hypothetical protein
MLRLYDAFLRWTASVEQNGTGSNVNIEMSGAGSRAM